MVMIRPIFDPAIPVEVRHALLGHREWLRPVSGAPPALRVWSGRVIKDVVRALGVGAVCAALPGVLVSTGVFGRVGHPIHR